jgi:hypothetical protein
MTLTIMSLDLDRQCLLQGDRIILLIYAFDHIQQLSFFSLMWFDE